MIPYINTSYILSNRVNNANEMSQSFVDIYNRYNQLKESGYYGASITAPDYDDDSSLSTGSGSSSTGSTSGTTTTQPSQSSKHVNVAVVDFCDDSDADIDLDGDGKGDMAHGNVVAHLINASFKNANVWTFDIASGKDGSTNDKLVASLQQIIDEIKSGECKYDAVNMSLSSRITYSDLSKALGVTITRDNASQYEAQIRNWLLTKGKENGYPTTAKVVELLEQIQQLGTKVYIAAANVNDGTDDELNLYTLVKNSTDVGALNKNGGKASFSFNNSLIDAWALGEIEVKKIKDSNGNIKGYDLNNDGIVDIDGKYTSGGKNAANPFLLGTSFATPTKLIQDLF